MNQAQERQKRAELAGAYKMCALLLTSPRFNKSQREVIEEEAYKIKDQLDAMKQDVIGAG